MIQASIGPRRSITGSTIARTLPVACGAFVATFLFAADSGPSLIDAAKNGDKPSLRTLLQQKADVNAADPDGSSALHWAAYRDDRESVDALLRAGAKVSAANDLGVTPLWLASQNGSFAVVEKLLTTGANPNAAQISGLTPLMIATHTANPAVVKALLARGANVNAATTETRNTALIWAAGDRNRQQHHLCRQALLQPGHRRVHGSPDGFDRLLGQHCSAPRPCRLTADCAARCSGAGR